MMGGRFFVYFGDQVIDLTFYRPDRNLRIQKPGRTDDLLCTQQFVVFFIVRRSSRYEHHLVDLSFKFFKIQGTVVQRRWQAETVVYQCRLAGAVTGIHSPHLWQCNVGLIHNDKEIFREIVDQCTRRFSRRQAG